MNIHTRFNPPDKEINYRIAKEIMGWTVKKVSYSQAQPDVMVDFWQDETGKPLSQRLFHLGTSERHPQFTTSREQAFLMEAKIAERDLTDAYIFALAKLVNPNAAIYGDSIEIENQTLDNWVGASRFLFDIVHATPAQRAQAAVYAIESTGLKERTGEVR